MEHGQCLALRLGQFDAGAIAALEAFLVDAHLLALEPR